MQKYILNGVEYKDYRQYNHAYNNLIRSNMMASYKKDLKDIPIRQKRRPQVKRYRTYDFSTTSEKIHTILTYVLTYLLGVILFIICPLLALYLT
jgi:hypothetical protein